MSLEYYCCVMYYVYIILCEPLNHLTQQPSSHGKSNPPRTFYYSPYMCPPVRIFNPYFHCGVHSSGMLVLLRYSLKVDATSPRGASCKRNLAVQLPRAARKRDTALVHARCTVLGVGGLQDTSSGDNQCERTYCPEQHPTRYCPRALPTSCLGRRRR